MRIRPPAVAGTFYPADPAELTAVVERCLAAGRAILAADAAALTAKALIAPHAGYVYSGPVAGTAYALIRSLRAAFERVVLLGPAHRVALHGLAVSTADAFATPIGTVPIDGAARDAALACAGVRPFDRAHEAEHCLEVHLPFLQRVLGRFGLLPLVVGAATGEQVAAVVEHLWGGDETLVVVSSDLSHYHGYATAQQLDRATCDAIAALAPERLDDGSACGRIPISGLLAVARRRGLRAHLLDLRNSGDTAGPRDEVVGYASFAFA